jgi:AraC-like DNA-binding protein
MIVPLISARTLMGLKDAFIGYVGENGLDAALTAAHIPVPSMEHPEVFIPQKSLFRFFDDIARQLGDQNFGLTFGVHVHLVNFGTWGHFLLSHDTLEAALFAVEKSQRFHINADKFTLVKKGDNLCFVYTSASPNVIGQRHYSIAAAIVMMDLCRHYMGRHWSPLRVDLDVKKARYSASFEDVFQCPVTFDNPSTCMTIHREEAGSVFLCKKPSFITQSDLRRSCLAAPTDLIGIVKELVRLRLLDSEIDIDGVASPISLSPRTLQRRLADEGIDFRTLVSQVRAERAVELLRETQMPVSSIAADLGYSTASHFSRAFRKTTGALPSDIRSRLAG